MMKKILFLLCFVFILLNSFSNKEISSIDKTITITALKLDKDRIVALKKIPKQTAFTINKKGILKATKDYKIVFEKSDKVLIIIPKKMKYQTFQKLDGYEEIELPSGDIIGCMCDRDPDNCHFDNSVEHNRFVCTGSCGCYIGVIFNFNKPPLEYETVGGRWFNF